MTSSLNDVPGTDSDKPPLGQLLVDAGLLSLTDLEEVLAKQLETGLPLGRMLVDGGYVADHSVAMALAEQHGGLLKTEYGFATGRAHTPLVAVRVVQEPTAAQTARDEPATPAEPSLNLRLAEPAAAEPPAQTDSALAELQAANEDLQTRNDALQAGNAELQVRTEELHARNTELQARNTELQARNEELQARNEELRARGDELEVRYVELDARLREVELARDRAVQAIAEAERRTIETEGRNRVHAAALTSVRGALEGSLAQLRAERSQQRGSEREGVPTRVFDDDRHVLFVPTPAGYVLRERPGPAPEPGAEVVLERLGPAPEPGTDVGLPGSERFRVLRVGPSPLPGATHACAYLDRIEA